MEIAVGRVWRRIGVVKIKIVAESSSVVGLEIRMCVLETIVHDADDNVCAPVGVPHIRNVHVNTGRPSILARVSQMPLLSEVDITRCELLFLKTGKLRLGRDDAWLALERLSQSQSATRLGGGEQKMVRQKIETSGQPGSHRNREAARINTGFQVHQDILG
jgi:hypothetical protein